MEASERWVNVEDVAAHLGVAKDSVYRWIDEQRLPAHRIGRLFRFKLSEIDEWIRQGKGQRNLPNTTPNQFSSKPQTNKSTPETRSRKTGGNE